MPDEKTPQKTGRTEETTPEKTDGKDLPQAVSWQNILNIPKGIREIAAQILTGFLIRTAPSGDRIELSSNPKNKIIFLNDDEEVGSIEVNFDPATDVGILKLVDKYDRGLEMEIGLSSSEIFNLSVGSGGTGLNITFNGTNGGVLLQQGTELSAKYFGISWESGGSVFNVETNSLPTTNPGGSGRLWNDAGTVKIT